MADIMLFIETPIFTEDVNALLTDEEYRLFQVFLTFSPESGDVIPHTGGLRKVRWPAKNKGKRSGVRVIYFHKNVDSIIRLLLIDPKGVKDDLEEAEKRFLRQMNERW
ncbi:cytotoxic translational repressor of toxin-antitoxin stability system [Buttiauxella ferragutiae ATCC 51602]|uniref:Cytotoxic translational repressor of toxin-antitoxin stability system n=2 Tax=Buttiauxella ferragutiae TaxID=82989 RepID=A0ABX2W7E8_9ENTR|nr:cytotoxic translational repressor of toxin-antitoxin stability system [Buttiauxella ferragutiae ATCC 51602]